MGSTLNEISDTTQANQPANRNGNPSLRRLLEDEIRRHGSISFTRFMERALYEPDVGYYNMDHALFGPSGDFITSPGTGPLFARCLAVQCADVLEKIGGGHLIEIGPGDGAMAAELLPALDRLGQLPEHYHLWEISPHLRQRQEKRLSELDEKYRRRLNWLTEPPKQSYQGVIVANEVVDALPVCRLCYRDGQWRELQVSIKDNHFHWLEADMDKRWDTLLQRLPDASSYTDGYLTELNVSLPDWLARVTHHLQQGMFLCVDYGYTRNEYMHEQRNMGTLLCHYRHRAHDNPFDHIGEQDITASVDFTLLAEEGHALGLDLLGYGTQAGFLLALGIEKLLADGVGSADEAKRLLLPGAMGDRFQVLALGRNLDKPLVGFSIQDHSWRL